MTAEMVGLLTDEPQATAYELTLAKQMADTLHRHYPGHIWGVSVSVKTGMADVRNMAISGRYGYRLKLVAHYSSSDWDREVMRAGGEILERYGQARGRVRPDRLEALPMDFSGNYVPDLG